MTTAAEPTGVQPLLRVKDLRKTHRSGGSAPVAAVRGVDLEVESGEFVAITGPSGAGKSTLLQLLGGLHRPDAGEIHLAGRRVDTMDEAGRAVLRRRKVGIVFQSDNLLSGLTIADNIELPALLAGHPAREARRRRQHLLAELGLSDRTRSAPGSLSTGERQRVALARALVNQPVLLLADEPTGNLDSRSTREVLSLLSRHQRQGGTIVLVTHDARVAASADRVISLFDGQVAGDLKVTDDPPGPGNYSGVGRVIDLGG